MRKPNYSDWKQITNYKKVILTEAKGGTLYIKDIGELNTALQSRLHDVLETKKYTHIGSSEPIELDMRIIVATRFNIKSLVEAGSFRDDLYYQLNILPINIPALRDHYEDIPALLEHFVNYFIETEGLSYRKFSVAAQNRLRSYAWPGNVRELKNIVQRLLILGTDENINIDEIEASLGNTDTKQNSAATKTFDFDLPLRDARENFEKVYLEYQLKKAKGSVSKVANAVGVERTHPLPQTENAGNRTKMKIIILGAGQVGASVAANLVNEDNDITLVDNNPAALQLISERYDLRTITGIASHPSVLAKAGAKDADMILAVTNSDEVNMIACQVAYTLFHTPTKIARIREEEYLSSTALFAQEALPIDVLISPEQLVTEYIKKLIEHPGALQVLDFADGKAQMVALKASYSGLLVGHSLRELRKQLPGIEYKIAIIFRDNQAIIPNADTTIEANDEIFFISSQKSIRQILQVIRFKEKPLKSIMIAGGWQYRFTTSWIIRR